MCVNCKKRIATVFISKVDINGNQINEGLCLVCAKELHIPQVDHFFSKMGIADDEIETLTDEMTEMMTSMQGEGEDGPLLEGIDNKGGVPDVFNLFKNRVNFFSANREIQPYEPSESDKDKKTGKETKKAKKTDEKNLKYLTTYATNLNEKAKRGDIDAVVGREKEIERVIQILNRRTKNNPVLLGEPGVGKTAIAEGLALRIVNGDVPVKLSKVKLYQLDLTAMIAGTQFRGQFEARMKGVLDEVKSDQDIILVIDEIHNIMGVGEAEGSLNAANILKPALSRGEIQVIGTTTLDEYRKRIEKDGALERRFQPVFVEESTAEETIEILKGIRKYYEYYHKVKISDSLIEDAVYMAERYITDRFLPDKAIDVIDEAASRANLRNDVLLEIGRLEAELQENKKEQLELSEIDTKTREEEELKYKQVAELKARESVINQRLEELYKKAYINLEFDDIARVIENWTGIPVQTISEEEAEKLLNLEKRLKQKVIGQDKAVEACAKAIRRNRSGFRKRFKPSSFIFVGPTGVGKTELAKQLTLLLFGNLDALVRLDMSEYMEKHTVSKLIGSPPGYIGYDEAGQFTEKIRRRPYSVILLDEIEKAHEDVFNMLLQILDDGRLTDSQGRTVNFENTVIIMTSNAGTSLKSAQMGFVANEQEAIEDKAHDALKKIFRPEFLNRVDDVVVFNKLDKDSLYRIAWLMLAEVIGNCESRNIKLVIGDDVIDYLVKHGYDDKYGARPLRRLIQKTIEDELSEMYLRGVLKPGCVVNADVVDDKVVLTCN
ncbi:MAG TPA: ATP-dependent Clp protease ATP-binding subunit [Clostridiaceae bacterium]|nr:ATP-dependent Clp protease ATP-binding subunit [Clostridiaceae bacterium]